MIKIPISTEVQILMGIMFTLAFWGFMSTITPASWTILTPFNFGVFGTGLISLVAVCTVSFLGTSICGAALAVFGFAQLLLMFIGVQTLIQTLIILPLTIVIIYIVSRLGRG